MDGDVDPVLEGADLFDAAVGPGCGVGQMGRAVGE